MVTPVLAYDRARADDGPVLAVVACTALGAEKIIERESSISEGPEASDLGMLERREPSTPFFIIFSGVSFLGGPSPCAPDAQLLPHGARSIRCIFT